MKRLIALSLSLALIFGLGAITVTVGNIEEESYHLPLCTSWYGNYTQQIYKSELIDYEGEISKIRFFHCGSFHGSLNYSHEWMIYLGHTDRDCFASLSDWEPLANLSLVFAGSVLDYFPPAGEWMEIPLQIPFVYDNEHNLVVAIYEDTPNATQTVIWGGFTCEGNAGSYISWPVNPNNPAQADGITDLIAAIQLVFPDNAPPKTPALAYPENNATMINGKNLEWTLPAGSAEASGYDVYIDDILVSENQTASKYTLDSLETGPHTWYVVAKNQFGSSQASETGTFILVPSVRIGDGTYIGHNPIFAKYTYNYTQTIYLQSDIDIGDRRIEKISYYWHGGGRGDYSNDWVVYMGHTQLSGFSRYGNNVYASWIPVGNMVQVFAGKVDIPNTPGWVEIELEVPFVYNNIDNLVIAVDENTPGVEFTSRYFYSTVEYSRNPGIYYNAPFNLYSNPKPEDPPGGTIESSYPNILMEFGELPSNPVLKATPSVVNFGELMSDVSSKPIIVTAYNAGEGSLHLSAADISILGPDAADFSFDPLNLPAVLEPGQFVRIPVSVMSGTVGDISATLRLVCNGENSDVELIAKVLAPGNVIIGDGTLSQWPPLGAMHRYDGSIALYTADQIKAIGSIDMLAWDCAKPTDIGVTYRIWCKNTSDSSLSGASWMDMVSDMTFVKEGILRPSEIGWQNITLNTPFPYAGQNLLIAVRTARGPGINFDQHPTFTYTYTGVRGHHTCDGSTTDVQDNNHIDHHLPNIKMHLTPIQQKDIAAVSITGEPIPQLGIEANFKVRVRNNGNDIQDNYLVKLMGADDVELAAVNGPPINSGAITEVTIPWAPATLGPVCVYGKVEMEGDAMPHNNRTETLEIYVHNEGTQSYTIGRGNEYWPVPIDIFWCSTLYQCIFLGEELDFGSGPISALAIYNRFYDNCPDLHTKIYLGSTSQDNLSDGFIPANELTLVYDGDISYPVGTNTVFVPFQTEFNHTGGNLVMAFHAPWIEGRYCAYNEFKSQYIGGNRAVHTISDRATVPYDAENTPEARPSSKAPQTTFYYIANHDLMATSITGNDSPTLGETSLYTIRIRNSGLEEQTDYTVKLMGADDAVLGCVNGPPISSMQSLDVAVPWMPETLGQASIYGKVEADTDETAANNCTASLNVIVYPVGVTDVTAAVTDTGAEVEIAWWAAESAVLERGDVLSKRASASATGKARSLGTEALKNPLELEGFMVYRLQAGQEQDEILWTALTESAITDHCFRDDIWFAVPGGDYLWAVKAVYDNGAASLPGFSGVLSRNVPNGTIVGKVRSKLDTAIAGATISNGYLNIATNSAGNYSLLVPAGTYPVTASAPGFASQTVRNVVVNPDLSTTIDFILLTDGDDPQVPPPVLATALHGNYPNPFNPETTISYSVKEPGRVRLEIYNIKGQLVRTLVDEEHLTGNYKLSFDGKDNRGRSVASGVYLLRMRAPGYQKRAKMVLMR